MKFSFFTSVLLAGLAAILSIRCNEQLPVYVFPKHVLSLSVTKIETVADRYAPPSYRKVHVRLQCQNIYDDVFQDSIDIKGSMRIWWFRNPDYYKTFTFTERNIAEQHLIHNGKITLLPGQTITIDVVWDITDDHGLSLLSKMNFARMKLRECSPNIACADPEEFVIESSLNVFDRLGMMTAEPQQFIFVGQTCISCGFPPCEWSDCG